MTIGAERALSDRISASFRQLSESASLLNAASDELGNAIAPIDAALKKLNLGVATWYRYSDDTDEHGDYCIRCIGYAKVGGKWGLALLQETGSTHRGPDSSDQWLFNDAPRSMRIEALDSIPDLIDALVASVHEATAKLQDKTKLAREVATTLTSLSNRSVTPR